MGVERYIRRQSGGGEDAEQDVARVSAVLGKHRQELFLIFDYYAALNGAFDGQLSLNYFSQLVDDCGLASNASKNCRKSDLDRIFIAADAASANLERKQAEAGGGGQKAPQKLRGNESGTEKGGGQNSLSIDEFIYAVVMIACHKYVLEGTALDVADALQRLIEADLLAKVDPAAFKPPDEFRGALLYQPEVDEVLRRHEASLRTMFGALVEKRGPAKKLLTYQSWHHLLKRLNFVGPDLSSRDATMAFVWSRMAVTDPHTDKGSIRARCLPLEGFMEAICRIAVLKALPTDADLSTTGFDHAGHFLAHLRNDHPSEYASFLEEQHVPWGGAPKQEVSLCVHHCICLIIHTVEEASGAGTREARSGAGNLEVSEVEMKRFLAMPS